MTDNWSRTTHRAARSRRLALAPALALALVGTIACAQSNGTQAQSATSGPAFNADSAYALLAKQVAFGPRVPGTPGHAAQLQWMTAYLRARADTVVVQSFDQEVGDGTVRLHNVFAQFQPENPNRVLLVAHWDTRPSADEDPDEAKRTQPIEGANDGASGVAVLLQLADMFAAEPPPVGVDILLTDGEDYATEVGDYDNMYLGANYFARNKPEGYAPLYGILVDMVGDQNPRFEMEGNSLHYAREVVDRVWRVAEEIGYDNIFVRRTGMSITDDHVPLNAIGKIRTIDIIDMDYGPENAYWHTQADVLANTSPRGLGAVGTVLATLIYRGG